MFLFAILVIICFFYAIFWNMYLNKHDIAKDPKLIVFITRKLIRGYNNNLKLTLNEKKLFNS